jgi:hypothetical protein
MDNLSFLFLCCVGPIFGLYIFGRIVTFIFWIIGWFI